VLALTSGTHTLWISQHLLPPIVPAPVPDSPGAQASSPRVDRPIPLLTTPLDVPLMLKPSTLKFLRHYTRSLGRSNMAPPPWQSRALLWSPLGQAAIPYEFATSSYVFPPILRWESCPILPSGKAPPCTDPPQPWPVHARPMNQGPRHGLQVLDMVHKVFSWKIITKM
jgi:hypothetical protein